MRHLYLALLPLLLAAPSLASVNPAEADLQPYYEPIGLDNRGKKFLSLEGIFCRPKWDYDTITRRTKDNRCWVQFSPDSLSINGEYSIQKNDVARIWRSDTEGAWHYRYFLISHKEEDKLKISAFYINHDTWQVIFLESTKSLDVDLIDAV